jgi:hypothetical protein
MPINSVTSAFRSMVKQGFVRLEVSMRVPMSFCIRVSGICVFVGLSKRTSHRRR